jgi:outer membrane protein insertion porin family
MNTGFWKRLCCVGLLCAVSIVFSAVSGSPEALPIRSLTLEVVGEPAGSEANVLSTLQSKEHERFSQGEFDKDLKQLAKDFDKVEPTVSVENGEVTVALKVWKKPIIHDIIWNGIKTADKEKLVKEFGIASGSVFDRQGFSKAIQKLRQYLVRKGFFESELDYKIVPLAEPNTIDIEISIKEGRAGYIEEICFQGLTSDEIDEVSDMILTKEYCFWLSWLNNQGTFYKDVFRQDEMTILRYLQNKGYLDAKVETVLKPAPGRKDRIVINIKVEKGKIYKLGNITTSGNILFTQEALLKASKSKSGEVYSPEGIRLAAKAMYDLYGSKGYIDAAVVPEPKLRENERIYDVDFKVEEGKQFRVGMIEIIGNTVTEPRVILHENLLVPGAVFDSNLLAKTEERLRNIGYFKTVNVYAVKSSRVDAAGAAFRDVHIEVDEVPTTAQFTAFAGWNSNEGVSGGFGVSESNFRLLGFKNIFSDGFRSLRGGGEYASANVTIGSKQLTYNISWTKPYFLDTKWTVGVDLQKMRNSYSAKDYTIKSDQAVFSGKRELNSFVKFGTHYRIKDSDIDLHGIRHTRRNRELIRESKNGGVISAAGVELYYDSTNHPVSPREGIRSELSAEYAGIGGDHHFLKFGYLNSLFYPLTAKGVLKFCGDAEAIQTLFGSKPKHIPLDERYYLGGDTKMRGFRYNTVGPKFRDKDRTPRGGMTSLYLSSEYEQPIYKKLSGFVFVDAGNVWWEEFVVKRLQFTAGFGLKFYIAEGTPLTFGMGYPIHVEKKNKKDVRHFFFSIGVGF